MKEIKRLAPNKDGIVIVGPPITQEEIEERSKDYPQLTPFQFAKKYKNTLFAPIKIHFNSKEYEIQLNRCTNPFCYWYGETQFRFTNLKYKPSIYRLSDTQNESAFCCNPHPLGEGYICSGKTTALSNWGVADEIARLTKNDRLLRVPMDYDFHRDGCLNSGKTPFEEEDNFYRRGKSTSNSQKWQCKECRKMTNVLPSRRECFTYKQKRNEIVYDFAKQIIKRIPVRSTCEILDIGSSTYYSKLELLYTRCLEFLERFEQKPLEKKQFSELWLDTDMLIYNLNNVRRRGMGGKDYQDMEDLQLPTYIAVTTDVNSRYVFRCDVAYDFDITTKTIYADTIKYKEDHLSLYARKNARLRISAYPQPPSSNDPQTKKAYEDELKEIQVRERYVAGMHTNYNYTLLAHYWLIRQMLNVKDWRFVSDNDSTIIPALSRIFAQEIRDGYAHHFVCKSDHFRDKKSAYKAYKAAREELYKWSSINGIYRSSIYQIAHMYLREYLEKNELYHTVDIGNGKYQVPKGLIINHPLPSKDEGKREITCRTNLSNCDLDEITSMIMQVNNKSSSAFLNQIRRSISILERPLATARGDGKSYIYANFNPRYAQYATTILRTHYNFCVAFKTKKDGLLATPAQRLGITNKQYELKDIVYFQ